jgi:hypothetical protein
MGSSPWMKAGLSQNWAIKSGEDDMNIDEPEVPHFWTIPKSDCCRPCPTRSHIEITNHLEKGLADRHRSTSTPC